MKASVSKPTEEDIRLRAYYRFLSRERDAQDGSAVNDWLLAEAELADQTEDAESHAHIVTATPPAGMASELRRLTSGD